MNCEEAIRYIHSVGWHSPEPGTERIAELLHAMGDPQKTLSCIHVAGTNGKGSTCAMLDSILRASGYRVGLFTSPYIRAFTERIRLDGENIAQDELASLTEEVKGVVDSLGISVTEFELITAIAFAYFVRKNVDYVVLEVGLGGRFDPTNVIPKNLLAIITGIDFDHTALLGNTIQEIAAEKAGIIKEGCPCLYGGEDNAAYRTIRAFADKRHAPFYTVDRSSYRKTTADLSGTVFDFDRYRGLHLPLLGSYQPYNATLVLTAVSVLETLGLSISEDAVRRGLEQTRWMARFELLASDPIVIYDGGHNPQGVLAAVKSICEYFPEQRVNVLSGVMIDKDFDAMIEELKSVSRRVFTVTPNNPRALSAQEYAAQFASHQISSTAYDSIEEGVRDAIRDSRANGVPLICLGSLYLYSDVADAVLKLTQDS